MKMTSHLLFEGILDVKVPRGNTDRKLLKAWRRQWTIFSVIYPSGKVDDPFLQLEFTRRKSTNSKNRIRISRDGLHIYRCRSKSRPYRTWAITSGNEPLLFFAAETEVRSQEWMQALRDGLWPPSFYSLMHTICGFEVSLMDNEHTLRSGHLGAYGCLVLTSETIISLIHLHRGSTLLQIPVLNIQDVTLVREAEISPAGVFGIIFKGGGEESGYKTLQFYCKRAMDAIQWILSKLSVQEKLDENYGTTDENLKNASPDICVNKFQDKPELVEDNKTCSYVHKEKSCYSEKEKYEKCLDMNKIIFGIKNDSHKNDTKPYHNSNINNIYENGNFLKRDSSKENLSKNLAKYATVNTGDKKLSFESSLDDTKYEISRNQCNGFQRNLLPLGLEFEKPKNSYNTFNIETNSIPKINLDLLSEEKNMMCHKNVNYLKRDNDKLLSNRILEHEAQGTTAAKILSKTCSDDLYSLTCISTTADTKQWDTALTIPSNSAYMDNKNKSVVTSNISTSVQSSPTDHDARTLEQLWIEEDYDDDQDFTDHLYEHLLERKGTIYEEIDDDIQEEVSLPLPPQLPDRPRNLEIPFHLFKLSQNINEVLHEMVTTPSPSKEHQSFPKLVGKIKETGRIMHI